MQRRINKIIVHHSEGRNDTFETIKSWQTTTDNPNTPEKEGMGWTHVAYHFVIERNGKIFRGVEEAVPSGGTKGSSSDALEVCLCGDYDFQAPTPEALSRLRALLTNWCKTFGLTPGDQTIVGHKDVQPKKGERDNRCPGKNLQSLLPKLRTEIHRGVYARTQGQR